MKVTLKRISKTMWDELISDVTTRFKDTGKIDIDKKKVEESSEIVFSNGIPIELSIDSSKYNKIVKVDDYKYNKIAKLILELRKDIKMQDGSKIAMNILNEKEVWSYLSLVVFDEIVKDLRLDDEDKITPDKIERFYFNTKTRSRTGLLFIWTMGDLLDSDDEFFIKTAFEFIDPVKAIYERAMGRNPILIKAFVQSIINNNCDKRLKGDKYKSKSPKHINCFSCINILDVYGYDELVDVLTKQINTILNVEK